MSRKRRSGATGGPSGSCHRAGIHKKGSLVLDAFALSSPNLPALIQLAGIIVQPVTQTLFRQHRPIAEIGWRPVAGLKEAWRKPSRVRQLPLFATDLAAC